MKKTIFKKAKPERDWRIIIVLFGIGLLVLSAFAWKIYLSDHIGGGYLAIEVPPVDVSTRTIDLKRLHTTTTLLETRQTNFENGKASKIRPIDPSL
jgi:hypothetical protein